MSQDIEVGDLVRWKYSDRSYHIPCGTLGIVHDVYELSAWVEWLDIDTSLRYPEGYLITYMEVV